MVNKFHILFVLDEDDKTWKNYRVLLGRDRMMGVGTENFTGKWYILYSDIESILLGKGTTTLESDPIAAQHSHHFFFSIQTANGSTVDFKMIGYEERQQIVLGLIDKIGSPTSEITDQIHKLGEEDTFSIRLRGDHESNSVNSRGQPQADLHGDSRRDSQGASRGESVENLSKHSANSIQHNEAISSPRNTSLSLISPRSPTNADRRESNKSWKNLIGKSRSKKTMKALQKELKMLKLSGLVRQIEEKKSNESSIAGEKHYNCTGAYCTANRLSQWQYPAKALPPLQRGDDETQTLVDNMSQSLDEKQRKRSMKKENNGYKPSQSQQQAEIREDTEELLDKLGGPLAPLDLLSVDQDRKDGCTSQSSSSYFTSDSKPIRYPTRRMQYPITNTNGYSAPSTGNLWNQKFVWESVKSDIDRKFRYNSVNSDIGRKFPWKNVKGFSSPNMKMCIVFSMSPTNNMGASPWKSI